ncbi:MAG: hypothetical protein ACTSY1_12875 [Alphaproteobacteria bacterium]
MSKSDIPMAVRAQIISSENGANWLATQKTASDGGAFFGACNFYSFLARKPA